VARPHFIFLISGSKRYKIQSIVVARPYFIICLFYYESFQKAHRDLIDESLLSSKGIRQPEWTESIAVGSERFIEEIKKKLKSLATGRRIIEN